MKKNAFTLILFILLGLLAASIVTRLLTPVDAVDFLLRSTPVSWHPAADLQFVKYDFFVQFNINLLSLVGIGAAVWIYRKV